MITTEKMRSLFTTFNVFHEGFRCQREWRLRAIPGREVRRPLAVAVSALIGNGKKHDFHPIRSGVAIPLVCRRLTFLRREGSFLLRHSMFYLLRRILFRIWLKGQT